MESEPSSVGMESKCLIDVGVLAHALRRGLLLDGLCATRRIAVNELALESVGPWKNDSRCGEAVMRLARAIADGRVEVLRANVGEIAAVVRWVGSERLSGAELEAVALALAGKGGLCTRDAVVIRVMRELGIEATMVSWEA